MNNARDQLLAELRSSGAEAEVLLRSLPADRFEEGRYENGWNARQILAHIAAIEWTYPRLLDLARSSPAGDAGGRATSTARGGIDDYNARQVEKRAAASIPELIAEFAANRSALVEAVAAADESLFATPIRSAGGREGTLATVLHDVAVAHVRQHVRDIAGAGATT